MFFKKLKRKIKYHWLYRNLFGERAHKFKLGVKLKSKGICGLCGGKLKFGKFSIHHIHPRRTHKCLRYNIKNGVCLCKKCHEFCDMINNIQEFGDPNYAN